MMTLKVFHDKTTDIVEILKKFKKADWAKKQT